MVAIIYLYCNYMLEDFKFLQMQIVCLDYRYNEPETPDLFPILFVFVFISNLVFNISSIKIPTI